MKRSALFILLLSALASRSSALETPLADWVHRFHVGGNAAFRLQAGAKDAQLDRNNGASVYQAGLVFDVDVAPNWSVWADMDLIREAQDASTFKEQLYVRRDNAFGASWLNAKLGRTFTPFGDEYLKWNQISNYFASWTVAFPWALDEGALLFGDILPNEMLSYAASLQNGNAGMNFDDNVNKTGAIKLFGKPLPWLSFSSSFLNLGKQGNLAAGQRGSAEFWLSGFHIQPIGATTANMGTATGASASNIVSGYLFEQDLKAVNDCGELWANFGYFKHMDGGGRQFDRYIRYYAAHVVANIPKTEKKAYAGLRYSGIQTMSATEGYRFAGTQLAVAANGTSPYNNFNYNQRDLYRWSMVAGWWFDKNILAKAEYSFEDSHLISSAMSAANNAFRGHRNFFVAELALRF
ncbi:MAG: hypothetical protein HY078_07315 [Elusimicrobia bacterium]|nr:hypothetical protein [Elusimicrobiota bacterium]